MPAAGRAPPQLMDAKSLLAIGGALKLITIMPLVALLLAYGVLRSTKTYKATADVVLLIRNAKSIKIFTNR